MILYDLFFRRYGVRRMEKLASPGLYSTNFLEMPRGSILHYLGEGLTDYGISMEDPLMRNVKKISLVEHNTHLTSMKGNPRPITIPVNRLILAYHRKNRRIRPLKNIDAVARDDMTLVIENYALIPHLYRYIKSMFSDYYRWYNVQATFWDKVEAVSKQSTRNQFVVCRLPEVFPAMQYLRTAEEHIDRRYLNNLVQDEARFIGDIWTWLGTHRENAIMSRLSFETLAKVNLIFMESGRFFVINLGMLNDWRKHPKNEMAEEEEHPSGTTGQSVQPNLIQRRFLRSLMMLFQARTVSASETTHLEHIDENESNGKTKVPETEIPVDKQGPTVKDFGSDQTTISDTEVTNNDKIGVQTDDETVVVTSKMDTRHDHDGYQDGTVPVDDHEANETEASKGHKQEIERVEDLSMDEDLRELDAMATRMAEVEKEGEQKYTPKIVNPEDGVMLVADRMAEDNLLSAAEYRRFMTLSKRYQDIENPYADKGTLQDLLTIAPAEIQIAENRNIAGTVKGVADPSMQDSSLEQFDPKYIKHVLHKDIAKAVIGIQAGGVAVQNYTVEHIEDLNNSYTLHKVKVVPVIGAPSTLEFRLPAIDESGTFKANGVTYRMRKQRGDFPIRKISPDRVALTSYYGKVFVYRSERKANNYAAWILNRVTSMGLDKDDRRITDLKLGNTFDHLLKVPRIYSIMASQAIGFKTDDIELMFNYHARKEFFGENVVERAEGDGMILVGKRGRDYVLVDNNNVFYVTKLGSFSQLGELGTIENILKMEDDYRRPLESVDIDILGKPVPLGFLLAAEMGLTTLLNHLGIESRPHPQTARISLDEGEEYIQFADETIIVNIDNKAAEYLMTGFARFHRNIKRYKRIEFDRKSVYSAILDQNNLSPRYLREMELMKNMFVDHITKEILEHMQEPTDFVSLLFRATEMLVDDQHPAPMDMNYMRDKGYERLAGAVYGEIVRSMRAYKARPATAAAVVDLNPHVVWQTVLQDPAALPIHELNPIANLREKEVVVFGGVGGRNSRSMTAKNRMYHESNMGVVSEATSDSSDVATVTYLTADPNYVSVRGISRRRMESDGPAKLVSTGMLLSPGADRDDPKRVNFISIQHQQTTAAVGYTPTPLRTGYESVIAHRTDELFATTAKQDGQVISVDEDHVRVRFKDDTEKSIEIGRRYGVDSGVNVPHDLVCDLKPGQLIKRGDVIAYNKMFFAKNPLIPSQVVWKAGIVARTALMESTDTFEDSCSISEDMAAKLKSHISLVRSIKLRFDQEVHDLVREGEHVDIESILCTIEDPSAGTSKLFDEASLATLKLLSNLTPKAKMTGTIDRIKVVYNGNTDDMSPSLKALTLASDRKRVSLSKRMNKPKVTGEVDSFYRVDNQTLEMDTLAIQIFITGDVPMGIGDKGVFANQMKTTVARILTGVNESEDGQPIDAFFGYKSVNNRIVNSATVIGTTNALLKAIGKRATEIYGVKPNE